MAIIHVNLSLVDTADVASVLPKLRAAGLRIESSDAALGVVSGSCDEAALEALRAVAGVSAVERAHQFQLPGRGEPVQ